MNAKSPPVAPTVAQSAYKVLVAVAFEPTAHAAMAEGMRLAARSPGTELHVVHALGESGPPTNDLPPQTPERIKEAVDRLRVRIEEEWQQVGELQVIAHVRVGDPAQVILQTAVDIDADVIVVGSHRRTGVAKLVLGSVGERVLHDAHCPVFVAVAKNYGALTATARIEPPCADCVSTRKRSANQKFWCERHSRPYLEPHIYVPRDQPRSSVFPTY